MIKGRVVLVGFQKDQLRRATAALSDEGFEVAHAPDAAKALTLCEEEGLLAVVLPSLATGTHGEHLAAVIRHHLQHVVIVFGCHSYLEESYLKSRFAPPVVCLQLPWDKQALMFAVRSGVDQAQIEAFGREDTAVREGGPSYKGNFRDKPIGRVLVELLDRSATGILVIENATVQKTVYLHDGIPTYAESNLLSENLGRFLVQRGVITDSDLARARAVQLSENIKQGEALVKIGALSHAQLFELLRQQIEEKIVNCFALDAASYVFEADRDFLAKKLRFELNPLSILIQGNDRFQSQDIVRNRRDRAEQLVLSMCDPQAPMWQFAASALPAQFADWIQRRASLADIMTTTGWTASRVSAISSALCDAGMCRLTRRRRTDTSLEKPSVASSSAETRPGSGEVGSRRQETPQETFDSGVYRRVDRIMKLYLSMQAGTYYEVLDVPRNATNETIKEARDSLMKRYAEDEFNRGVPRYARVKVREVVEKIRVAGDVLLDSSRRRSYDAALDRPSDANQTDQLIEAEVQHILGLDHLRERDFHSANEYFSRAADLNPDEPTYLLYSGWAGYQGAPPSSKERLEAKDKVTLAIDLNPLIDVGYFFLGSIYLDEGEPEAAIEQFETALHFNPENEEARAALASLSL